jgi:hypothetical protein
MPSSLAEGMINAACPDSLLDRIGRHFSIAIPTGSLEGQRSGFSDKGMTGWIEASCESLPCSIIEFPTMCPRALHLPCDLVPPVAGQNKNGYLEG